MCIAAEKHFCNSWFSCQKKYVCFSVRILFLYI